MVEIHSLPKDWVVFDSAEEVAETLVNKLLRLAQEAIDEKGVFTLVTAGGTTPQKCYEQLAQQDADWLKWHIYMGDERCLPADDKDRNSVALTQAWLYFGKIPAENIHLIPAELGATLAAHSYQQLVDDIDLFDVVLLGMGEDGHTASLFPGHHYPSNQSVVTETRSPKPPSHRVSLSYERLGKAKVVFKIITGQNKREAVKTWLNQSVDLPIRHVEGQQTWVYIDSNAL